jgi:uncharacterized protein YeeX (DUF496 family)
MAKKSKTEVKPELEPQINEVETTNTSEETTPVEEEVVSNQEVVEPTPKTTKKSKTSQVNEFSLENSGLSKEHCEIISQLVKSSKPRFCLEVGFSNTSPSLVVLNSEKSIQKYISTNSNKNISSEFSCFSVNDSGSQNLISQELSQGIDLLIFNVDSSYSSLSGIDQYSKWIHNGGNIVIFVKESPDWNSILDDYLLKNKQILRKSQSISGLQIISVNRGLFRAPTS